MSFANVVGEAITNSAQCAKDEAPGPDNSKAKKFECMNCGRDVLSPSGAVPKACGNCGSPTLWMKETWSREENKKEKS